MEKIYTEFQIGSTGLKSYRGPVFLDEENLYLVPAINAFIAGLGSMGGFVGGLIAGSIARAVSKSAVYPFQTTYAELPEHIRNDPVWGKTRGDAKVIVLPRSCVTSISCSIWSGCTIKTEGTKFVLPIFMFGIGKARRLLEKYGWVDQ